MSEILSEHLFYRELQESDVTGKYVHWLNDPEINRYLEVRHVTQTIESCIEFVKEMNVDQSQHLFGIFLIQNGEHIGNIKLGFINQYHLRGQLSLFIGDSNCWRKGYASEAIRAITKWGFDELGLGKIEAGCCEENVASRNVFLNVGYKEEGFFREHALINGQRIGSYWLGILPNEISE